MALQVTGCVPADSSSRRNRIVSAACASLATAHNKGISRVPCNRDVTVWYVWVSSQCRVSSVSLGYKVTLATVAAPAVSPPGPGEACIPWKYSGYSIITGIPMITDVSILKWFWLDCTYIRWKEKEDFRGKKPPKNQQHRYITHHSRLRVDVAS